MSPDDPPTAAHDHTAIAHRAALSDAAALVAHWRAQRTARGVLLLAYIAPVHVRKPTHSGNPPEGWTKCMIMHHLLSELDGVWWVPDGAVEHMKKFTLKGATS